MKRLVIFVSAALLCCTMSAQTREQNLIGHVYYLASDAMNGREAGSEDAAAARKYIISEYSKAGLVPYFDYGWEMPFKEGKYNNVVGFIEGNDPRLKNEYIVLGAHYDHLGVRNGQVYNGADDNASGTAALIEVARYLCENRDQIRRSVIIAAFDAEEIGLFGSKALAAKLDTTIGSSSIKLMMSIDMVGWLEKGEALKLEGVATIQNGKKLLQAQANAIQLPIKPVNFEKSVFTATDTEYFAKKQVPTLAVSTGLKSPYHKPQDDPELIDYDGLDKVTEYIGIVALDCSRGAVVEPSGKVADKHRSSVSTFTFGLSAGLGSAYIDFPDAALDSKTRFSYEGGLVSRVNFGKKGIWGIQAECLFNEAKAFFPNCDKPFGSPLTYKRQSLMVPVSLFVHTNQGQSAGGAYVGLGGLWSHDLKESLPSPWLLRGYNFGTTATFGLELGSMAIELKFYSFGKNLFQGPVAPKSMMNSTLASFKYFF